MEFLNASAHVERFVYPLFGVSNDSQLLRRMTLGTLLYAFAVFFYHKPAPYGRHKRSSRGLPAWLAWLLQESPSFYVPLLLAASGRSPGMSSVCNCVLLGMFVVHYIHRSLIYPLVMRSTNPMPLAPFVAAFLTCTYNGVLQGVYFAKYYKYDDAVWLYTPLFWIGAALYLLGMKVNISSDHALRNLRKTPGSGYVIPRGGLFRYVSCPNYLGEVVQMWGFALASCAPPAVAHALFTSCFLLRRASQTHQWYQDKFEDYPKERKAILPYLF